MPPLEPRPPAPSAPSIRAWRPPPLAPALAPIIDASGGRNGSVDAAGPEQAGAGAAATTPGPEPAADSGEAVLSGSAAAREAEEELVLRTLSQLRLTAEDAPWVSAARVLEALAAASTRRRSATARAALRWTICDLVRALPGELHNRISTYSYIT